MKPFDAATCPLAGVNLIEAAAGTGKTHALAGLYLRFLVERKLSVRQLLVITYTNAATAELRKRIRETIIVARDAFIHGSAKNDLTAQLLKRFSESGERKRIVRELDLALAGYDETAIFTIHGFCRRLLTDHAFAGKMAFEAELVENQQALEREFVADFWRRHFYGSPPVIVAHALVRKVDPESLRALLRLTAHGPQLNIIPDFGPLDAEDLQREQDELRETFLQFCALWRRDRDPLARALADPALSAVVYGRKVDALVRDTDALACADDLPWPLPPFLEKLGASYLRGKTRKNRKTPEHPLFDLAETVRRQARKLSDRLDAYLGRVKKEFLETAAREFPRLKQKQNLLYFDDLLLRAYEVLHDAGSEKLAGILRGQFPAVLVDEFQDTDPLQFAILQSVFADRGNREAALFYIGDPKQAIYSFRGADIYAYLRAAKSVDRAFTLTTNWRSEAPLLEAVNILFEKPERPFIYEQISYRRIEPAAKAQIEPLTIEGASGAGLEWWFVPGKEDGSALEIGAARLLINRAVVAEIARLLALGRAKKAMIGAAPLDESHIAILVRKNAEAMAFKKLLSQAGIPSVIYSSESVFTADEVQDFRLLMLGMIHCEEEGHLLSALATPFFGLRAGDIALCLEDEERLEDWRIRFRRYAGLWQSKGILTLFFALLEEEGARRRIAALPGGERRLTNYGHLAGLLFQAQAQGNLRPSDVLGWLERMSAAPDNEKEDQQLRLETDRRCVRIVTIHKSKGLEYPVCFCPFAWETGPERRDGLPLAFHDEKNDWRITVDLGSEELDRHRTLYERDVLAENCRLLYVALTRAKNRCYFVWGNIRNASAGAVSHLFYPKGGAGEATDEEMPAAMRSFAERSRGAIRATRVENVEEIEKWTTEKETGQILYRPFAGKIDSRWKIASYTFLTRAAQDDAEWDEQTPDFRRSDALPEPPEATGILSFPPGATSGILLHEILEKIDFSRVADERTTFVVTDTLEKFGYPLQWQAGICRMLRNLVQTKLPAGNGEEFDLSRLAPEHCLRELEFYFPLKNLSPAKLLSVLESRSADERRTLHFPPVQGFLKGFIDLVFEYEGRFYLADWKSNDLGGRPENYEPEGLRREMMKAFYDAQYLIYTVALDAYLEKRKPNYIYDRDFGGVFYFFLRGLAAPPRKGGVFYDRPDGAFIARLKEALLAF